MTIQHSAPSSADLDAARLLLTRPGISPADLLNAAPDRNPASTQLSSAATPILAADCPLRHT